MLHNDKSTHSEMHSPVKFLKQYFDESATSCEEASPSPAFKLSSNKINNFINQRVTQRIIGRRRKSLEGKNIAAPCVKRCV